jgi:hypothetical protein
MTVLPVPIHAQLLVHTVCEKPDPPRIDGEFGFFRIDCDDDFSLLGLGCLDRFPGKTRCWKETANSRFVPVKERARDSSSVGKKIFADGFRETLFRSGALSDTVSPRRQKRSALRHRPCRYRFPAFNEPF